MTPAPRCDAQASTVPDAHDSVLTDVLSGAGERALAAARDDLACAGGRYDEAILAARAAGFSWGEISRILGVSRQTLHRRFATGRR
jgi:DNA-directed RNA polymerase specialized sigma24 family protein